MNTYAIKFFAVTLACLLAVQNGPVIAGSSQSKTTNNVKSITITTEENNYSAQTSNWFTKAYRSCFLVASLATTAALGVPTHKVMGTLPQIALGTGLLGAAGLYAQQHEFTPWMRQYCIGTAQALGSALCIRSIKEVPSEFAPIIFGALALGLMLKAANNYKKIIYSEK